jgi:hypothetical protein
VQPLGIFGVIKIVVEQKTIIKKISRSHTLVLLSAKRSTKRYRRQTSSAWYDAAHEAVLLAQTDVVPPLITSCQEYFTHG